MTADIELLPLYAELQGHPKLEIINHYARANVTHAAAAKDAEIEALRAEVERLGADSRMQAHTMELVQARAERAEAEAEALREEVERWRILHNGEIARRMDADDCAERLAEALRDALECGNDGDWQSARQYITAALRDHDQEVGNG